MTKKLLALFLALLMLLSFAACAGPTNPEDTSTSAVADSSNPAGDDTASLYDDEGYLLDDLGDNLKFNDETVKILYWSDAERNEFEMNEEDLNGNIVDEAIYSRNVRTQERLKVTFEWDSTKGNNSNRTAFAQYVTNQQSAGNFYDIIGTYTRSMGILCTKGFLKDLETIDGSYIDWNKPWWPDKLVDTCKIGNSLYFCSGDISTNVLHFMYVIWYNIGLAEDLNLDDPIKLVDDHQWTIDKLIDMTKDLYSDLDSDGKLTEDDRYGFTSIYYGLDAFYTGSELRLVDPDADKLLKISDDYTSAKCIDLMDKLGTWCVSPDCYINGGPLGSVSNIQPFVKGNAVFCQNRVYIADNQHSCHLNEVEWTYGVLPTPLYNTEQEKYITVLGNPVSLWGIQSDVKDKEALRDTAVIECMASYGYRLTTPALFETNMKYKYTKGAENDGVRMFDIVHNGIDFDLGRIFSDPLDYMSEKPSKAAAMNANWGAQCGNVAKSLAKALKTDVVTPIQKLQK